MFMTIRWLTMTLALTSVRAQSFEAASIRRNVNGGLNTGISISGGRITCRNASLKTLIRNAYGILSFQLAGEPSWLDTEMYDIVAVTGGDKIGDEELKRLLRNLLADRFHLQVHWETRETTVYALVVDKGGAKIKPSTAEKASINGTRQGHFGSSKGVAEPITILASNMGNQLGRIVTDETGLRGVYDWYVEWDPDPGPEATLPSLLTALPRQLGLKLEARKGPMEVLVIDHAERATEN